MTWISRVLVLTVLIASTLTIAAEPQTGREEAARAFAKASLAFADAKYFDAYTDYRRVISSGPSELTTLARKGAVRTALYLARFDLARREADQLVEAASSDAEALTLRGDALWSSGFFDEADVAYENARLVDPQSARVQFGMARSLNSHGRVDQALAHLEVAARRAPMDPEICVLISDSYERLFRYQEAARSIEGCAALIPRALKGASQIVRNKLKMLRAFEARRPLDIEAPDTQFTLPFQLVNDKIQLRGKLNGRSIDFVLDTGADRTAVSRQTATDVRLVTVSETNVAGVGRVGVNAVVMGRADSLQIGPLTIRDVPVVIRENAPRGAPESVGDSFSPQAAGLSLIVDYERRQVTLARNLPLAPADITLPLRTVGLPMVRGLLNEAHPAYFVVDTGGEMISISTAIAARLSMPASSRKIMINVWGANGRDRDAFVMPGVDLKLDEIAYPKHSVAVLNLHAPSALLGFEVGGILGHQFLKGYKVAMDLPRGQLRLQRR